MSSQIVHLYSPNYNPQPVFKVPFPRVQFLGPFHSLPQINHKMSPLLLSPGDKSSDRAGTVPKEHRKRKAWLRHRQVHVHAILLSIPYIPSTIVHLPPSSFCYVRPQCSQFTIYTTVRPPSHHPSEKNSVVPGHAFHLCTTASNTPFITIRHSSILEMHTNHHNTIS